MGQDHQMWVATVQVLEPVGNYGGFSTTFLSWNAKEHTRKHKELLSILQSRLGDEGWATKTWDGFGAHGQEFRFVSEIQCYDLILTNDKASKCM